MLDDRSEAAMTTGAFSSEMNSLGERFEIERELGRGGSATVYLAHDRRLGRQVAVKVLDPGLSAHLGADRFTREIRLTARLVHPNIVPLFESGEVDGRLYYVMPFIEGDTLRSQLDRDGPLSVDDSLRLVCDLAEALTYAHSQHVVHRDIKPENVFICNGHAMLADFGIAQAPVSNDTQLTEAGLVIGTATYMSPEQAVGERDLTGSSDLYSLGCMLFELLTGVAPFRGPNSMSVVAQHLTAPPPPLVISDSRRGSPLAGLIAQLLSKEPTSRPVSASALLEMLRPLLSASSTLPAIAVAPNVPSKVAPESRKAAETGHSYWTRGMMGGPGSREKLEMARTHFQRALQLDPQNAEAVMGLADTILVLGYRGFAPFAESVQRARDLRFEALAMDDENAAVHISIGFTMLYWEDDFEGAGIELKRGFDLDLSSAYGPRSYGTWLKIADRRPEAIEVMRRAVEINPSAAVNFNALGDALMTAGRYDEAIEPLRQALRLNPQYEMALERLEIACHRGGREEDASVARRSLLAHHGQTERLALLEEGIEKIGWAAAREADVRRELVQLLEQATSEDPFVDASSSRQLSDRIIVAYAELGEWKAAMDWVERGFHRRPGRLRRVLTDFLFDRRGLAIDPRYAPLLRNAGLESLL
jgi:tetratricopeptide (TPR) repeat protein/tRNA A-37 threonylcarbamoyl transferase component Bud32